MEGGNALTESYNHLETVLRERNITPYRLSKETGVSTATLSNWKFGRYTPKIDKIKRIADFLDIPIEYFIEEETTKS